MNILEQNHACGPRVSGHLSLFRNSVQLAAALSLLLIGAPAFAKPEKMKVCHVSSDGKVNLLVVSPNSYHVGNPAHFFDGLYDYEPHEVGASGEGTFDSNGDGIDDGCEPSEEASCPCFDSDSLMVINGGNHNSTGSCANGSSLPNWAIISATSFTVEGLPGTYFANLSRGECGDNVNKTTDGTTQEIQVCINLIAERCASDDIGSPIPSN